MSAKSYEAVVIGGGVSGLVAACALKRKRVLVVEARNRLGGLADSMALAEGFTAHASLLYALDPLVVKELKLSKYGLKFAVRDMVLTGLGHGGRSVSFSRDVHDTVRAIAAHSRADAEAWPLFRAELFTLARAMRPFWGEVGGKTPRDETLERLKSLSAAAWLDSWFESDAVKAALAFDACDGGLSPFEPGSALILVWRAAQEMSGLQGAVAQPQGAALLDALTQCAKARNVEIRTGVSVTQVMSQDGVVHGVFLSSGEILMTRLVLSSLSRRRTLRALASEAGFDALASLAPDAAVGEARVAMVLKSVPPAAQFSRFVAAERLETYAAAWSSARAGKLADEVPVEFVVSTMGAPPGQAILTARVRPVPVAMTEAMKAELVSRIANRLDGVPHGAVTVLSPKDIADGHDDDGAQDLLSDWSTRLLTPIAGLLLCGAEPVPAISGRAARIAAAIGSTK